MVGNILLLATFALFVYVLVSLLRQRQRSSPQGESARLNAYMAARPGAAPATTVKASTVAGAADGTAGQTETTQRFKDENGAWVEVTKRTGSFPGGIFSISRSTRTAGLGGGLLDQLLGGGAPDRFPVVPASELPTFADVGGMEDFKNDVRETLGLILRHGDDARTYGIQWNGVLLHGPPGGGKTFLARALAGEYGLNLLHVSTGDLVEGIVGQSARNVQRVFQVAESHRPCLLFFDEFDSIAQRRDDGSQAEERRTVNQLLTSLEANRGAADLIVMAATNDLERLDPAVIRPGRFDRHVRIDLPDRAARRAVLEAQLRHRPAAAHIDLDEIADRTAGLTPAALAQIVDAAALRAFREAAAEGVEVDITMAHFEAALEEQGGKDRPTVEEWDWDHLVLPQELKAELRQLQAMLEDPELARSFGVDAPTGVLLAGPPGTGKTTVARVLAAQARCSFYPVSAADVTSKWVGESERSIQRLFERARANKPSIIFIDELDAIATTRGDAGDAASRQLNQLLVEIDGLTSSTGVLVIGATNRPELIDHALLRGGRLSRTIHIELPDAAARATILRLATARMPTVDVDIDALAAATEGFSGADLKAACQQAALHAMVRASGQTGTSGTGGTSGGADPNAGAQPAVLPIDFERALGDRRS